MELSYFYSLRWVWYRSWIDVLASAPLRGKTITRRFREPSLEPPGLDPRATKEKVVFTIDVVWRMPVVAVVVVEVVAVVVVERRRSWCLR